MRGLWRSLRRTGRLELEYDWPGGQREIRQWLVEGVAKAMRDPHCILVNVQSVIPALMATKRQRTEDILRGLPLTPPFERLWLEWTVAAPAPARAVRMAILVVRTTDLETFDFQSCVPEASGARHLLQLSFLYESRLGVRAIGATWMALDAYGAFLPGSWRSFPTGVIPDLDADYVSGMYSFYVCVAGLALAQMNCKNVTLRPTAEPKLRSWRDVPAPACIWHEIVISGSPLSGGKGLASEEPRILRLHWVRGHFADYRENGLFGRLRGIYWIPEHRAGNPDYGQIIPAYKIGSGVTA